MLIKPLLQNDLIRELYVWERAYYSFPEQHTGAELQDEEPPRVGIKGLHWNPTRS